MRLQDVTVGLFLAIILLVSARCGIMAQQQQQEGGNDDVAGGGAAVENNNKNKNDEEGGGAVRNDDAVGSAEALTSNSTSPVRMVTLEELQRHDGIQTDTLWLSIMGRVYDVTAGSQYYGNKGPYKIFVAKDANVPFITGSFTDEEAQKPLVSLTAQELYSLETWTDFYDKEEKYQFIGLFVGEMYDELGNPTEAHFKIKEMIEEGKQEQEERKRERRELIAKRKLENEEKRQRDLEIAAAKNAQEGSSPEQEL
jgi:membrane-associated progesterone receptor component